MTDAPAKTTADRLHAYFPNARAVVTATHDADITDRFCNRPLVFEHGRIMEEMDRRRLHAAA